MSRRRRTKRKLIRRRLRAKTALERAPITSDELVIMNAIMFAPTAKRAVQLNGTRIQFHQYIERFGLGYGRRFFLRFVANETKIMRRVSSAGRPAEETIERPGIIVSVRHRPASIAIDKLRYGKKAAAGA